MLVDASIVAWGAGDHRTGVSLRGHVSWLLHKQCQVPVILYSPSKIRASSCEEVLMELVLVIGNKLQLLCGRQGQCGQSGVGQVC